MPSFKLLLFKKEEHAKEVYFLSEFCSKFVPFRVSVFFLGFDSWGSVERRAGVRPR